MKANVGSVDRTIRIIIGLAIIVIGIIMQSWWGLVGILPLATGLASRCGLYSVLGINTCKIKETQEK
jgi:hypothetical protein